MTNSVTNRADARTRLVGIVHRVAAPRTILAISAVLVLVGVVGASTDHVRLTLVMVLLLQGCLILLTVAQRVAAGDLEEKLARRIDQASARQLADLARTRHALLTTADSEREDQR